MIKKGKPTEVDVLVGENLRKLRKAKGLSQSKLSERCGVSFQQIQKYERGVNRVSASMLWELHKILEVELKDFYGDLA